MTTTAPVGTVAPAPSAATTSTRRRTTLALVALATGGFTIGTTEFVTMGLLPEIADGVGVSVPTAGHVISAYAVGVVVGAPVLAFLGARLPRRGLLVALMVAYAVANVLSAVAGSLGWLIVARFVGGVPHGAFFGVASLVAANLVSPERRGRAIASVMLGLSIANVVGVPAVTWLGQHVGWRSAYGVAGLLAVATVALMLAFVPASSADRAATGRRELRAFREPQVWLTLLVGAVGFGGMFALFSYISPTVTKVGGLPSGAVPVFLLVLGLGMVLGTWAAGVLADWSVYRSMVIGAVGMGLALLVAWLVSPYGWVLLPVTFAVTFLASLLVVNLQLRLMDVAGDAQTIGAALNHASLNIANALGAWLGGIVAASSGYRSPALLGVGLSALGLIVLLASGALDRSRRAGRSSASTS